MVGEGEHDLAELRLGDEGRLAADSVGGDPLEVVRRVSCEPISTRVSCEAHLSQAGRALMGLCFSAPERPSLAALALCGGLETRVS